MPRANAWVGALFAIAAAVAVACGGGGDDDSTAPRPTPTVTPDLSNALSEADAIDALAAIDPRFGSLFASATTGDVTALEELFYWQERPCGDPAAGEAICPPETPPGTVVKSIEYGPVSGAAEMELIDGYLRRLAGSGLRPRLILLGDSDPPIYFISFTSDERVQGEPPLDLSMPTFKGVELTVDLSKVGPIIRVSLLTDDWEPHYEVDTGVTETILLYEPEE